LIIFPDGIYHGYYFTIETFRVDEGETCV